MADDKNPTVQEAVKQAVQEENKPVVEETKVEEKRTIELTSEVEEALQLMAGLKDENLRPGIIQFLAERQGLLKKGQEVEDLSKKEQKTLKDRLLAKIPDQYKEVMPWIADLIEEGVSAGVEEKTKDLETRLQENMAREVRRTTDAEVDKFYSTHEDAKDFEKEMAALAKKMPQGEGVDMQEYLENLYIIASKNATGGKIVKETVQRINKNAKNDLGKGAESNTSTIKFGSKLPSVREAVNAAARGQRYTD